MNPAYKPTCCGAPPDLDPRPPCCYVAVRLAPPNADLFHVVQVMLRPLVEDVLDLTRSLVDSKVELRNSIPPGMSVSGDAGRIVQILNNLLGNAAKFTRKGHIRVSPFAPLTRVFQKPVTVSRQSLTTCKELGKPELRVMADKL